MSRTLAVRAVLASLLTTALSLPAALPAAAVPTATDCAEPLTVVELQRMLDDNGRDPATDEQVPVSAEGLTVVSGTTPRSFSAEILDIDYGGIGIDHDLIIAELSGLGIDGERGVWAGMSGSPVYVGDKLVGAVSYGFTWGPSSLAGITPAEEMLALTDGAGPAGVASPESVHLSRDQRGSIAAQTGSSVASVPSQLPRLQVPLAINASAERITWLQREARRDGSRLVPVAGRGFRAGAADSTDIAAGGNFAASLSYGDITAAGTGTTTWTCGNEALAFGHPFFWQGATTFGLHAARAVTVATDPAFGSYKLATLGDLVGEVDEDRYAGLTGTLARIPFTTPVTSFTIAEHPDGSLSSDDGMTRVTYAEWVPFIAFVHGFANIDFLLDRYYSEGSSELTWTVRMTHRGVPYRLRRTNRFNSRYDISIESMIEPWLQLERLAANRFGPVRFDAVHLRAEAVDQQRYWRVRRLEVRRAGRWQKPDRAVRVDPGDTLRVRAVLSRYAGTQRVATTARSLWFQIPRRAAGARGRVQVGGGGRHLDFCFLWGECGGGRARAKSFPALVRQLRDAPRNDALHARMTLAFDGRGVERRRETLMSRVVRGTAAVRVRVTGGGGRGSGAPEGG